MPVYKSKNGTYYIKYNKTTKRGFKTKREAKTYEAKLKVENINSNSQVIYIYDIIDDFLQYYSHQVAYTSFDRVYRILNKYIKPYINNKPIDRINEKEVRDFYEYINSLPLSTTYKNDIFNTYKRLFEHSIKFFGTNNNPTKIFDSFKKTREEKISKKNKDFKVWTNEEFIQFISKVDNLTYKTFFITLYYTGIRLGEALALTWCDFKEDYLDINKTIPKLNKDGEIVIKEPKNISSIRKVLLSQSLIDCLEKLKLKVSKIDGFNEEWFIFGNLQPLSRSTINRVKDRAIYLSQVKRITIHDFRHSHASNLIADGVNIVSVSRRLGHSSVEMTLNVYTHLLTKTDIEMISKIEKSSQKVLSV